VADITYIRLREQFLYLAVVLDGYSRRVVGWALGESLEASLAVAALRQAILDRKQGVGLPEFFTVSTEGSLPRTRILGMSPLRLSRLRSLGCGHFAGGYFLNISDTALLAWSSSLLRLS
jgi:transposase InsO family protein